MSPSYSPISNATAVRKAGNSGPVLVPLAFWKCFQKEAEARVRECNVLAGERLWSVSAPEQSPFRLVIESTTCPGDFVECTLDPETGVLFCRPGPALTAACCEFRIEWGTNTLRMQDSAFTGGEALALILDELVFVHGDR